MAVMDGMAGDDTALIEEIARKVELAAAGAPSIVAAMEESGGTMSKKSVVKQWGEK
jgi:hypothetical protein